MGAGYCVDTADKNAAKIKEDIKNQLDLDEDKLGEQLSIPLKSGPFTGGR